MKVYQNSSYTTLNFFLQWFSNESCNPFGSKHCSSCNHTVARKNFTYIITSRRSGEGTSSQGFCTGGGARETYKSAPWRQELPCVFSHTDAKNRPQKGVWGETGVICVVHESVQEKSCKCTANFFSSLTKFVLYVEIPAGNTYSCFKDQQFHKQLLHNPGQTSNWRMGHGTRNPRPTSYHPSVALTRRCLSISEVLKVTIMKMWHRMVWERVANAPPSSYCQSLCQRNISAQQVRRSAFG